jgi:hypothetical protein
MTLNKKIFILFFVLLLISGCIDQIKSPVMPIWDVSYSIPVLNRTEVVIDRIKGEKGIFVDSAQNLILKFDTTEVKTKSLDEIFADNIEYDDEFSIKPQNVDTLIFESFVSDDSVYLEEFHLYKGTLIYKVENRLDKKVNLNITIPGFTKRVGGTIDTLKFEMMVQPNSSGQKTIDLRNYRYRYTTNPLGGTNYGFHIKGYAKIDAGYSGDSIKTKVQIKNLGFNYLKGKVKPYEDEIKPKTEALDLDQEIKDILPKVQVYGAKVILTPNTTMKNLEVRLRDFQIVGTFKTSAQKKYLKIKNRSIIDTIISLDRSSIELNIDDVAINEFFSPVVPDSISYSGKIIANPNYKTIDVTLPDTIKFNVRFIGYSIFRIDNASRTDTVEIDLKDEDKDNLNKVNGASLTLDIDNGLPIAFQITGYLLDAQNRKLFYFTREQGTGAPSDTVFTITPASIDNEGKVSQSATQKKILSLNKDEVEKLKRMKKAIIYVVFSTTNGKKVLLRANDRIKLKLTSSVSLRVGE